MKVSGKIIVKGSKLPEAITSKVGEVELVIEYDCRYSPAEIKEMINLIDLIPEKLDTLMNCHKKALELNQALKEMEEVPA